jgi:prefoldin alpha subunit
MSTDDSSQPQTIPLDDLSIDQLSQLQKQIDQELSFFTESVNELKGVEARFVESYDAVQALDPTTPGKAALIPLSESVRDLIP